MSVHPLGRLLISSTNSAGIQTLPTGHFPGVTAAPAAPCAGTGWEPSRAHLGRGFLLCLPKVWQEGKPLRGTEVSLHTLRGQSLIRHNSLTPGGSAPPTPAGPGLGRGRAQTQGAEAGKGRSRTGFVQDIRGAIPATEQIPAPGAGSRSGLTAQHPGDRDAKEMICTQRSPRCHLSVCTCCHLCHPAGHPGTTANPHCPGPVQRQSSPILTLLHS